MEFIVQRLWYDKNQTFGFCRSLDGSFKAHSLEDEPRQVKVASETRIPAGRYKLGIRKEDTPLTIKHRLSYNQAFKDPKGNPINWFKYHIEILNVPNFTGIYIHSGNDQTHTAGCLLLGDMMDLTLHVKPLTYSLRAVKRFYDLTYPKLERNEDVYINIFDEYNYLGKK